MELPSGLQNEPVEPRHYRIEFERTGGFAGMRLVASIDSLDLPLEEARRLEENLAAAGFFLLPEKPVSSLGGADSFSYRITVDDAGQVHTAEFGDASAPDTARPLIRQLTVLARQKGMNRSELK